MKKIVCIAVIAMSGIVLVSCDADRVESTTPQFDKSSKKKEIYNVTQRTGDSLSVIDTTNLVVEPPLPPGPGDDVPPITPPKP